jgi:hypothetical protein
MDSKKDTSGILLAISLAGLIALLLVIFIKDVLLGG